MQLSVSTNACSLTLLRLRSKFFVMTFRIIIWNLRRIKPTWASQGKTGIWKERALEAARLAEQNKEKDFKANIPLKRKCA